MKVKLFIGLTIFAIALDWVANTHSWYNWQLSHATFWAVFGLLCLVIFRNFWAIAFWLPLGALLEDAGYMVVQGVTSSGYAWMPEKFGWLGSFLSINIWDWPLAYPLGIAWLFVIYLIMSRRKKKYYCEDSGVTF